jgi:4-alpha-glucanotransferase
LKRTAGKTKNKLKTSSKSKTADSQKRRGNPALPALSDRRSGVLLHPTSLAGPLASGDLGPSARAFIDFLADAGFGWWQMLPVVPAGDAWSPYSTTSSLAGEELLVSPEDLIAEGLLSLDEVRACKESHATDRVNFKKAATVRVKLIDLAWERASESPRWRKELASFAASQSWLRDYALFTALSKKFNSSDWSDWPRALARRDPKALLAAESENAEAVARCAFGQLLFQKQWASLRAHAASRGVGLIGDIPIFVSHQSSDVWSAQKFFKLDASGKPSVVAGCPPDRFNAKGQKWGNALYDWNALSKDRYTWWIKRFSRMNELFDCVRLDHFIGFHRAWEIPCAAPDAVRGKWQYVPGEDFFRTVEKSCGKLPLIAEDLGLVTPEVTALREAFHFPGMRVVQFGFSSGADAAWHVPHAHVPESVAYSGTHDMDTARGYLERIKRESKKLSAQAHNEYRTASTWLGATDADFDWRLVQATLASVSRLAVVQAQDILRLPARDRMNVPGTVKGNWIWRAKPGVFSTQIAATLRTLNGVYGRMPPT